MKKEDRDKVTEREKNIEKLICRFKRGGEVGRRGRGGTRQHIQYCTHNNLQLEVSLNFVILSPGR